MRVNVDILSTVGARLWADGMLASLLCVMCVCVCVVVECAVHSQAQRLSFICTSAVVNVVEVPGVL